MPSLSTQKLSSDLAAAKKNSLGETSSSAPADSESKEAQGNDDTTPSEPRTRSALENKKQEKRTANRNTAKKNVDPEAEDEKKKEHANPIGKMTSRALGACERAFIPLWGIPFIYIAIHALLHLGFPRAFPHPGEEEVAKIKSVGAVGGDAMKGVIEGTVKWLEMLHYAVYMFIGGLIVIILTLLIILIIEVVDSLWVYKAGAWVYQAGVWVYKAGAWLVE